LPFVGFARKWCELVWSELVWSAWKSTIHEIEVVVVHWAVLVAASSSELLSNARASAEYDVSEAHLA
jgi:hypothetical protein